VSRTRQVGSFAILLFCWSARGASRARAQSLTAGEVAGTVRDPAGSAIGEALITVTDGTTGLARTATGTRGGRYRLSLVPPGEYEVLVEHLGYRPVRVLRVPVRSGTSADVSVTLTAAPPPVTQLDTVHVATGAGAGSGEWFSPVAVRLVPDQVGAITDLGRLSTISDADLATEGLPGSLSGFLSDGVLYRPARHPGLPGGQFDAGTLRLSTFDRAELIANGTDVEWVGVGGGMLSGFSRLGTLRLEPHFFADWTGNAVSNSKYFDTGAVSNSSFRGALMLTGLIVRNSAQFALGVEGRRLETPMPAAWTAGAPADSIATVAQDSFGRRLNDYLTPHVMTTDALTVFGVVNWPTSS